MSGFNNVVLVGNLTKDPELKSLPSGTSVADVGLAINDRVKKGDDYVEEVSYIDITVFGRSAENCAEYLNKGSKVLVHGRLKQDRWETEEGKRSKVKVIANSVQFMDPKEVATGPPPSKEQSKSGKDLPF
jgi:single-strand DNA-binding protein